MSDSRSVYRFDGFEVEPAVRQARRDGRPLRLEPKAFDLLLYLIDKRERVVAKQELFEAIWGGVWVTEGALTRAVTKLRRVLGDRARQPRYIETLHGRGYRFCAAVEMEAGAVPASDGGLEGSEPRAGPLPIGAGPHNIASTPRDFTGRADELTAILAAIDRGAGEVVACVRGMGGIGKSEFARRVAQACWDRYPEAHLEIDLAGASPEPLSPADATAQLLRDLAPQAELPSEPAALRRVYRNMLSGRRGILLLDNAASAVQVASLLPPEGWLTLVTSRFRFMLPGLEALDLGPLPEDEGRAFLAQLAPRSAAVADDLLRLTGRLPLALRLVGSALATHEDLPPAVLVRRLAGAGDLRDAVAATLSVSLDLLDPEQRARWAELAVFPGSFTPASAASVWQLGEEAAHNELSDFFVASMVEWSGRRYRLHDLARAFAAGLLADPVPPRLRHAAHFLDVLARLEERYLAGGEDVRRALGRFDHERRNIEAACNWISAGDHGDAGQDLLARFPIVGDRLLAMRLFPDQDLAWRGASLRAARKTCSRDLQGELERGLGDACCRTGDSQQALEHYNEALAIFRELGDRKGESRALANLGHVQFFRAGAREGLKSMEQSLAISRELGDRRTEGHSQRLLGYYYQGRGESAKAVACYAQAIEVAREVGDRNGEGIALRQLGDTYADLGDAPRSIECAEQAFAIADEMNARRSLSDALSALGRGYADLGNVSKSIECCEQALAIARAVNNRPCEHSTLLVLGRGHEELDDFTKALRCYQQAEAIALEIDHRGCQSVAWRYLAGVHVQLGSLAEALDYGERAFEIARKGSGRRVQASASHVLGSIHAALGDTRKAAAYYEQAVELARAVGNRRGEAFAHWSLSNLLAQQGELAVAIEHACNLVAYYEEIGHPATPESVTRVDNLVAAMKTGDPSSVAC